MPVHEVNIDIQKLEVLNRDVVFEVRADEQLFGKLTVSRGGVGWYPANAPIERHLNWERFDRLLREHFDE